MSLARVWRRQLYAASSAALVVPFAMLAAVLVLALGGGFSQVGVLGQIFVGPPEPSVGPISGPHARAAERLAGALLPVIPATVATPTSRPVARRGGAGAPAGTHVLAPGGGPSTVGGAIAPGGAPPRPVTQGAGGPAGAPPPAVSSRPSPPSSPPGPSPAPSPSPQTTPVDTVVKVVTTVTEQVPAPAGSLATQAVQSAGTGADSLLPQTGPQPPARAPSRSAVQALPLP